MSNILNDAAEFRKIKVTRLGRVGREHLNQILNNKMVNKMVKSRQCWMAP